MKRLVPIVIAIAALAGAGLLAWFLYLAPGPSEERAIEAAREDLRETRESLQREYPELLADPEKFFHREGRNGFPLCVQLEDKIWELNDASHEDERGDWWHALEFRDDYVEEDESKRKELYRIAITQSDALMPDVRAIVECDYILVLPDAEHRFELSPVYRVAQMLSDRCWAQLQLDNVEAAKRDAETCCRLCALVDRDSLHVQASLYDMVRQYTVGALFDVSERTRDLDWFTEWSTAVMLESNTGTALRRERVNIVRALEWTAERPDDKLRKQAESNFLTEYRDAAHVLESAGQFSVDYFQMISEVDGSDLDLLNPTTSRAIFEFIEKLGDPDESLSAHALGLIVESMEEKALMQRYMTLSVKLRKLELAGVELGADSSEVEAVLKEHPGFWIDWSSGIVLSLQKDHPRHQRGGDIISYHHDQLGSD